MRCNRDGNGPHFGEGQSLLPLERSGEVTYLTVGCADRIYRETVHAQTVRGVRTVKPLKANNSGKGVTEGCQGNQGCERPFRES